MNVLNPSHDPYHTPDPSRQERFRGCFLGGAVGDALGAPIEFMSHKQIMATFGKSGISNYSLAYGRLGAITDDSQMALFTAEGLLRAYVREQTRGIACYPQSVLAYAYQRWLHTQGIKHPLQKHSLNGWLIMQRALFASRAPGRTCISALKAMNSADDTAKNDSKGCGGVMRVAPVGMILSGLSPNRQEGRDFNFQQAFTLGCKAAGITHGHPTGKLASGAFSLLIFLLMEGSSLRQALEVVLKELEQHEHHEETSRAIREAIRLAEDSPSNLKTLNHLGEGWIAEEALAIGVYCALGARDFESGISLAVNHSGDSDSTGLIAGHLLGGIFGVSNIPGKWLESLELKAVISEVADDLATCGDWNLDYMSDDPEPDYYLQRYPPS